AATEARAARTRAAWRAGAGTTWAESALEAGASTGREPAHARPGCARRPRTGPASWRATTARSEPALPCVGAARRSAAEAGPLEAPATRPGLGLARSAGGAATEPGARSATATRPELTLVRSGVARR